MAAATRVVIVMWSARATPAGGTVIDDRVSGVKLLARRIRLPFTRTVRCGNRVRVTRSIETRNAPCPPAGTGAAADPLGIRAGSEALRAARAESPAGNESHPFHPDGLGVAARPCRGERHDPRCGVWWRWDSAETRGRGPQRRGPRHRLLGGECRGLTADERRRHPARSRPDPARVGGRPAVCRWHLRSRHRGGDALLLARPAGQPARGAPRPETWWDVRPHRRDLSWGAVRRAIRRGHAAAARGVLERRRAPGSPHAGRIHGSHDDARVGKRLDLRYRPTAVAGRVKV